MASLNRVLGVLKTGIRNIKATNSLTAPVVDNLSEVDGPEPGTWVYVTGDGERPEGMWRYTSSGWRSGSQTNRINFGRGVEGLDNNSNRRIANFTVPEGEDLALWTAQVSESSGAVSGTLLQLQDIDDGGATLYERDAGDDGIGIEEGNPIFQTPGEGHEYRLRIRNESGSPSGITAFATLSTEPSP